MDVQVLESRFARPGVDTTTFQDITDVECTRVDYQDGWVVITFAGDLTGVEVTLVKIRCMTRDAQEETLYKQARLGIITNNNYRAISEPTIVQMRAQLDSLSQQMNVQHRNLLNDL